MTYSQAFKYGNLVLPSALLFIIMKLFDQADDYLVLAVFFLQNTTGQETLTPNQIASHLGKTVTEGQSYHVQFDHQGTPSVPDH